jgi:hypothetical protein
MLRLTWIIPELIRRSQEPELGGPRTVGDSFEPLGVFRIVT